MTDVIRTLAELRATDVRYAGGKGANLGELVAAGLPVPDGFVVGSGACRTVLDGSAADALEERIAAALTALGENAFVAVRSSGVGEDGDAASYAGINETFHNVHGVEDVVDAIGRCCASHERSHVRDYAAARDRAAAGSGFAVVVQRQVDAARAGVAFSVDPVSGDVEQIVIEAALGHGEAVVSGAVTPDRIVVDKRSLEVRSTTRGNQQVRLEASTGASGLVARALDGVAPETALSAGEARVLAELVRRIEAHYGTPQDVEWAIDADGRPWILQARRVTTLSDLAEARAARRFYDPDRSRHSRWTRANIGEAIPGVPTPLTWSVWQHGIETAMWETQIGLGVVRPAERGSAPVIGLVQGWPVISVDLVEEQLSRLPGFDAEAFAHQFFGGGSTTAVVPSAAERVRASARVAAHAPLAVARLRRRLDAAARTSAAAWRSTVGRPLDDPLAVLEGAATRFADTLTAHTMQTYVCQALYQGVERIAPGRAADLVSGDGDLAEARLAGDLRRLGKGLLAEAAFLAAHGFHGPAEGELWAPSWREDPEPVRRSAASLAGDDAHDPDAAAAARRASRIAAEAEVLASIAPWRRPVVARLLTMARRAVVAREVGKSALLQDLDTARYAARALGDDAFWCTLHELTTTPAGIATIRARRRERARLESSEPELHITGDPVAGGDVAPEADGDGAFVRGIPASPGRAVGRARVVSGPAGLERPVDDDEILVARTTDPSWVTAFVSAAGLVVDVGGALSHAAIIARELGVPCVIGTAVGTKVIPDGAHVEIDGSTGVVRFVIG